MMSVKWIKRIFFCLCLASIGLGVAYGLWIDPRAFQIRSIPLEFTSEAAFAEGDFQTDAAIVGDVEKRLRLLLRDFQFKKIWEVDMTRLRSLILAEEWIEQVRISRLFPNHLEVAVTPRAPVFIVMSPAGRLLPMTADGRLMRRSNPTLLPDVPVLKGENFFRDAGARQSAIELLRALPVEGPLSRKNLSEVSWTNDVGYEVVLLPSYTRVVLGTDRFAVKVARIEQILDYLSAHQLKGRVIDASFSKKVLVRLRKGP